MAQIIIIAMGIEIRDYNQGVQLRNFLMANCKRKDDTTWTYPKGKRAPPTHEVRLVYDMEGFSKALDTPDAFVVYDGHSRYGQGPSFGPAKTPAQPPKTGEFTPNPWGVHFRMGYDATDTECISDIVTHSVTPEEYDLIGSGANAFLPKELIKAASSAKDVQKDIDAVRIKGKAVCMTQGAWRLFDKCHAKLADAPTKIRRDKPLKGRHYYKHQRKKRGYEYFTAVKVGAADLNKSALKCKLLFMASCSSHVHFFEPLDNRRKSVKSVCKFLLTHELSWAPHSAMFLRQLLIKRSDPMTGEGMKAIVNALHHAKGSGRVRDY